MKWTTKAPTEDGYYWYRDSKLDDPGIVLVSQFPSGTQICIFGVSRVYPLSSYHGEWYGPLKEPKEKRNDQT